MGAVAAVIVRRPAVLASLVVIALPFRVPIESGGITNNLLVPLYGVVAAGSLAFAVPALVGRRGVAREPAEPPAGAGHRDVRWVERLLALYVVLYALQAIYSPDFEKALQNMVFFYVPFALLFCLLRRLAWTPQLLRSCLLLVAGLAVLFALVGFVEYATKTLLLNPKLVAANNVHTYFVINSVFFDPDIFGRFLALVMILLAAELLYGRRGREQLITTVVLAVLWTALVLTLSRSSLGALLVGLGILAALRWNASWTVVVGVAVVAVGAAAVAASPTTFGLNQGANGASAGRAGLVSSGATMFGRRPLWGYGSGSFIDRVPQAAPGHIPDAGCLAHDPGDDRGRAGPDRRAVVSRAPARSRRGAAAPRALGSGARSRCSSVRGAGVPYAAVRGLPRGPRHVDAVGHRRRAGDRRASAGQRSLGAARSGRRGLGAGAPSVSTCRTDAISRATAAR